MRAMLTTTVVVLGLALASSAVCAAGKPVKKSSAKSSAVSRAAAPVAAAAPVVLSPEQLSIAQIVYTGTIPCAEGKTVNIAPDANTQGMFTMQFAGSRQALTPMPTQSGAVRLENKGSGMVFMQLANKSMLFNERQGKRLADECHSSEQQAVADRLNANGGAAFGQ
jgi:hypothetical protein